MRILITSDLHYGVCADGDRATRALAQWVCRQPADALLIGGYIGCGLDTVAACLELFRGFEGAKLAVPGNHDVWVDSRHDHDSWALHDRVLPALFDVAGFHPLHISPLILGVTAFVGSMGWYDYSFRDELGFADEAYETKIYPGDTRPTWNDALRARFSCDDRALTTQLASRLAAQLAATSQAGHTVALVHHLTTRALLVHPRWLVPLRWRFANAFLGSEVFGEALRDARRPIQVFCGHVHMARTHTEGHLVHTTVGASYESKELIDHELGSGSRRRRFGQDPTLDEAARIFKLGCKARVVSRPLTLPWTIDSYGGAAERK